jgi:tetraacyldisaccharide-1-P 4'-kinase
VNLDHNFSNEMSKQVKKIYNWPRKINTIVDEAEKQHREEKYVIEKTIIMRKKEFDTSIEELRVEIMKIEEFDDHTQYRMISPLIDEYHTKLTMFGEDKVKMENEETIMFGYKNAYENFETLYKWF